MNILMSAITIIYYLLIAYISGIILYNLVKTKTWEKELLYIVVLIPFLLRLFRLK